MKTGVYMLTTYNADGGFWYQSQIDASRAQAIADSVSGDLPDVGQSLWLDRRRALRRVA